MYSRILMTNTTKMLTTSPWLTCFSLATEIAGLLCGLVVDLHGYKLAQVLLTVLRQSVSSNHPGIAHDSPVTSLLCRCARPTTGYMTPLNQDHSSSIWVGPELLPPAQTNLDLDDERSYNTF